jgi:hypothetical protein
MPQHIHKCGLVIHLVTCESFCGICTSTPIEDLSKENDIHVFVGTFHIASDKERWQSLFTNEVSS